MSIVFLDTGILGYLTHPTSNDETKACAKWVQELLSIDAKVCIPEVCDYELRRAYINRNATAQLRKLDQLKEVLEFVPIQSKTMIKAANLWAMAKSRGKLAADPKELDCDVVLAAQALTFDNDSKVATTNVGHLSVFLKADLWRNISC